MKTCDTCKWWDADNQRTRPSGWIQINPEVEIGMAECRNKKLAAGEDGILSNHDAPTDGEGFDTGPKFGCIHWEGKP